MKFYKKIILIHFLLFIGVFLSLQILGKFFNQKIVQFSSIEAEKIAKYIVNVAVKNSILEDKTLEDLYTTYKTENNEINSIEFKSYKINQILNDITSQILIKFQEFEHGNSSIFELKQNLILNAPILGYKEGIVLEVPIGSVFQNGFLQNLGPKIPIRLSITGEIESSVNTSVTEYGINNALVTTNINIQVSEQILMPLITKKVTISNKIPISISIINGKIPNYYGGNFSTNSPLFQLPISNDFS